MLLLFAGFGSVVKWIPTLAAKAEQASSMAIIEPRLRAARSKSSSQATAPRKVAPMWHLMPSSLSLSRSSCMYTVNIAGESTKPCVVPLAWENTGVQGWCKGTKKEFRQFLSASYISLAT